MSSVSGGCLAYNLDCLSFGQSTNTLSSTLYACGIAWDGLARGESTDTGGGRLKDVDEAALLARPVGIKGHHRMTALYDRARDNWRNAVRAV